MDYVHKRKVMKYASGSLAVIIPAPLARQLGIQAGDEVEFVEVGREVKFRPVSDQVEANDFPMD